MIYAILVAAQMALCQDTATLSGKVSDAVTHFPVAGARVMLHYSGDNRSATTDENGAYRLEELPTGHTFAIVDKREYTALGSMLPEDRVGLEIAAGKNTRDFMLVPGSHISGRVVDADTEQPIQNMTILPSIVTSESGETGFKSGVWMGMMAPPSSAKGEFDIGGLKAGSYVLQMHYPGGRKVIAGDPGDKPLTLDYGALFYPESTRIENTLQLAIAPGERRRMEIRLRKKEQSRLIGSVQAVGDLAGDIDVNALLVGRGSSNGIATGKLPGPGDFYVDAVPDGEYVISAKAKTADGVKLFGDARVSIGVRDTAKVKLVLQPGITVQGRVRSDDDRASLPDGLNVILINADGRPPDGQRSGVDDKGSFRIADVSLGLYLVTVIGLPKGYAVLHPQIEVKQSDLDVVITNRLGSIAGKAAPNSSVVLRVEGDETGWSNKTGKTDDGGVFSFEGLAPGRYVVLGRSVEVSAGQTAEAK